MLEGSVTTSRVSGGPTGPTKSMAQISISPIEIRLTKDRLSLVSRVLSSNNDAYKHTEVILDLVRKLGFRNDVVAEAKALAMLAETALQAEDYARAWDASETMVNTVLLLLRSRTSSPPPTSPSSSSSPPSSMWPSLLRCHHRRHLPYPAPRHGPGRSPPPRPSSPLPSPPSLPAAHHPSLAPYPAFARPPLRTSTSLIRSSPLRPTSSLALGHLGA